MTEEKLKYCNYDEIKEIHCPNCKSPDFLDWEDDLKEIPCKCEDNPHLYLAKFSCSCGHNFTELRDDRY